MSDHERIKCWQVRNARKDLDVDSFSITRFLLKLFSL